MVYIPFNTPMRFLCMANTNICIMADLHENLKELKDTLGKKSFSELLQFLLDNYLDAPDGVPKSSFNKLRDKYIATYPDEFRDAVRMCIGITDTVEFEALMEEIMLGAIKETETTPNEMMIFQCAGCQHVWDYTGSAKKLGSIHCPVCGSTASKKWLRKLTMPDDVS